MTDYRAKVLVEWRRQHRRGTPSLLEVDQELRAYVDREIVQRTFADLALMIRETFGPERSISKSSLGRYWRRHKDRLLAMGGDKSGF
ncbi:hypothetical protein [Methylocaldum szegediense]|uniref:Transposase n=1 Tax=Methylocaldum szegediense TaxID=73780 RepID=A0ABM9I9A7_9GAMM|nr:hypothetical protein [Methylocaldum szegediense]CAI8971060.1 protein of unknown function [Methylocaldum szegediense]